jgi:cytochrome o ubiquinol oxidase subunit 2
MKRTKIFISAGLSCVGATLILGGCSHMVLLDPKGPIGDTERFVIITAFVLMLIVVVPAIVMALWFPRRYKASNTKAPYTPKWSHSIKIDLVVWLVPAAIVTALGILAWNTTRHLDPDKPIDTDRKPITIEAVSLDWKWLFIYPDLHIATVNQIVFPVDVPLSFRITSGTVLASFFIPQLGSQIYAMPGRQSRLHLMADDPGVYDGQNQQFSGSGYSDMRFEAIATSVEQFEAWVKKTRQSPNQLDPARFEELRKPSTGHPVQHFSRVEPDLFEYILRQYHQTTDTYHSSASGKNDAPSMQARASEER